MLSSFIPEPLLSTLSAINHRRKSDRIGCARGTHGKSCLLVMNGPSLNASADVLKAREADCVFSVNYFAESEYFETVRPDFYVFQDSHFWRNDVLDRFKEAREKTFAALNKKTDWPLTIFFPSACARRQWVSERITNPNIEVKYWNSGFLRRSRSDFGYQGISPMLFRLWAGEWASPPRDNVLIACLYLAERLGFENIEFIGGDFSFFLEMMVDPENNQVGRRIEHFYGNEVSPIYLGNTGEVPTTMAHEMLRWHRSFRGLEVLGAYLETRGVRVVNRSAESFIDCFERG